MQEAAHFRPLLARQLAQSLLGFPALRCAASCTAHFWESHSCWNAKQLGRGVTFILVLCCVGLCVVKTHKRVMC